MVVFSEKFESLHKNYCSLLTTIDVKIIMRKNNYVNILTSLQWHLEVELNLAFFEILRNLKNRLTPLQINGMFQIVFFSPGSRVQTKDGTVNVQKIIVINIRLRCQILIRKVHNFHF